MNINARLSKLEAGRLPDARFCNCQEGLFTIKPRAEWPDVLDGDDRLRCQKCQKPIDPSAKIEISKVFRPVA